MSNAYLDIVIRRAEHDDAAGLARVHIRSWQAAYPGLIDQVFLDSMSIETRTDWWERALTREGNLVWVADVDSAIEGFVLAGASTTGGWGEVYAIYVDAGHWGAGLGHALLSAAVDGLTDAGFERALLWVLRDNTRARAFYERQGWELGQPIRI
jgi:ribosomal protein S18 acetylase RimI-like enzyme